MISLIENTPALSVVMATADAFVPPDALLVLIETVGVPVYPLPSFRSVIEFNIQSSLILQQLLLQLHLFLQD